MMIDWAFAGVSRIDWMTAAVSASMHAVAPLPAVVGAAELLLVAGVPADPITEPLPLQPTAASATTMTASRGKLHLIVDGIVRTS